MNLAKVLYLEIAGECDMCNGEGPVAVISTLGFSTLDICLPCLKSIVELLEKEKK